MKIANICLLLTVFFKLTTGERATVGLNGRSGHRSSHVPETKSKKATSLGMRSYGVGANVFGVRHKPSLDGIPTDAASALSGVASARGGAVAVAVADQSSFPALKGFIFWVIPCAMFIAGKTVTTQMTYDLNHPDIGFVEEAPWDHIIDIGGVSDMLNHIKYGQPTMALYQLGSFVTFAMQNTGISQKLGAFLNIVGAVFFAACLTAIFPLLRKLIFSDGGATTVNFIGASFIGIATVPFLQLITWQIEYGLRALFDKPDKIILPKFLLSLVSVTNTLKLFLKPMDAFFKWKVFPQGFSNAGVEVVDALADADKYSKPEYADQLTPQRLKSINRSLVVQILYSGLVVVPFWALLTHFGIYPVNENAPTSCMGMMHMSPGSEKDPARWGVIGMVGPYWIFSFLWLLWGVWMFDIYNGFFKN